MIETCEKSGLSFACVALHTRHYWTVVDNIDQFLLHLHQQDDAWYRQPGQTLLIDDNTRLGRPVQMATSNDSLHHAPISNVYNT